MYVNVGLLEEFRVRFFSTQNALGNCQGGANAFLKI